MSAPSVEAELARLRRQMALDVAEIQRRASSRFFRYFPDCSDRCRNPASRDQADHEPGRLCRALYWKHMQFVGLGPTHRERLFLAANRIGKTEVAAFELTAHLTGLYPHWWHGVRFDRPTHWWAAGDTMLTTRDIIQLAMLGPTDTVDTRQWSGMLPAHLVLDVSRKSGGVVKCIDQVFVQHVTGGISTLEFKSYDQGRRAFQGTAQDGIWLDEECPDDVYAESLLRTMTTDGLILTTMTPLQGRTPFLQQWIETATMPDADGVEHKASELLAA